MFRMKRSGAASILLIAAILPGMVAAAILPEHLGQFRRGSIRPFVPRAADRLLLEEYGLRSAESADYRRPTDGIMATEALYFSSSEGAHAAYLALLPSGAVLSPLQESSTRAGVFGQTYAALAAATTALEFKNYVFRFQGGAPTQQAVEGMLDGLANLDPEEPVPDQCCRYVVPFSERLLLGPVSLAKFAPMVPPSVAGLHSGARGRIARFEMPAGAASKILFLYPSQAEAGERAAAFRLLPDAEVRVSGRAVGIIFFPRSREDADELLGEIEDPATAGGTVTWDPGTNCWEGCPMTLEGGISATVFVSLLGAITGLLRWLFRRHQGFEDHSIALHIEPPTASH